MKVGELIVEPGREEHIARHRVRVEEAEQVVFGDHVAYRVRLGRYGLVGQTHSGRYLFVLLAPRGEGTYALVTARDASVNERRLYRRQRKY